MITIHKDKYKGEQILAIIAVVAFSVFGLVGLLVTISFKADLKISNAFYPAMKSGVAKAGTFYAVDDGYSTVITFAFLFIYLIIESLFLYLKKIKPNSWFARHQKDATIYVIFSVIGTLGNIPYSMNIFFGNQGFGYGYNVEFQTGGNYLIPGLIISLIVESSILGFGTGLIHGKLAKQPDFLENQYGKSALILLLTLLFLDVIMWVLKGGFGRFYYYDVYGGDKQLNSPDRFEYYMNQTKITHGFNPMVSDDMKKLADLDFGNGQEFNNKFIYNLPLTDEYKYPGGKPYGGFFTNNPDLPRESFAFDNAFPSGHMSATFFVTMTAYLFGNNHNKKAILARRILVVIGIIYSLNMFFALQTSQSHGLSDSAFTSMLLVPAIALSYGIAYLVSSKLFPKIDHLLTTKRVKKPKA